MTNPKETFDFKEWQRKRKYTFIGFFCQAVCLGMEYSLTFITLWLYLDDVMKVENTKFFYSIISAAYLLSQVVSSVVFGRVVDKYRNVSMMFFIGNMLVIVGNILYTLPFTPWLLFVGRLISGGGGCLRAIMTSEVVRSYPPEELTKKFSVMGTAFALGFIFGPAINFAFLKMDFWIYKVHLVYANAPGMYLSCVFVIMQIIATMLIKDLSKEYDLKESLVEAENEGLLLQKNSENEFTSSEFEMSEITNKKNLTAWQVLCKIFKHVDTFLIVFFSFMLMYCIVLFDLWQPLVVIRLLQWGVLELNIVVFGFGIASVAVLLLLSLCPLSDRRMVYLSWICTLSIAAICAIFLVMKLYRHNNELNIVLWVFYGIIFSIMVVMEEIFLIGTMARMTHSTVQAFTESIRLGFSRMGALTALLTAAVTFDYLEYVTLVVMVLSVLGFLLLVWRRKSFIYPKVMVK